MVFLNLEHAEKWDAIFAFAPYQIKNGTPETREQPALGAVPNCLSKQKKVTYNYAAVSKGSTKHSVSFEKMNTTTST